MKQQLIKILETCLAYTRDEINFYDALVEIYYLIIEIEQFLFYCEN